MDSTTKTPTQVCPECHVDFTPYNNRKNIIFCSYACQVAYNVRKRRGLRHEALKAQAGPCAWCGVQFIPSASDQAYCGEECRAKASTHRKRSKVLDARPLATCAVCGNSFVAVGGSRRRYCSPPCRQRGHALAARKRINDNPGKDTEYHKRYREQNNRAVLKHRLKNWYGITLEHYEAMLEAQGQRCAICNAELTRPCVDHVHDASGLVRGILCPLCNTGLGSFQDSPETLRAAAAYLEKWAAVIASDDADAISARSQVG